MRLNPTGVGATLALHLLAVFALLSHAPAREALLAAAPIMVDLIVPPRAEPPKPLPPTEPPRPRPVTRPVERTATPPPILALPPEAPAPAKMEVPIQEPPKPAPIVEPAPIVVTPPVFNADYLENPAPAYPALSRRSGEQGRTILRVLVNARGTADEVQVRTSSGHPRLDDAARDAVRRWRFVPAKRGAEPIAAWVLIPISFRLEG